MDVGRRRLTCDKYVDGGVFVGLRLVSAAELAGVLGLAAGHLQPAAVLLLLPPTAKIPLLHLTGGQGWWERP